MAQDRTTDRDLRDGPRRDGPAEHREFVMDAVEFVAEQGHRFLSLYAFDAESGAWSHREYREQHAAFSLDAALEAGGCDETALPPEARAEMYAECLREAGSWADRLGEPQGTEPGPTEDRFGDLQFFTLR